jgi:hypothetical protein
MGRWPFNKCLSVASVIGFTLFAPMIAAAPIASNSKWSLRLPQDGRVIYRGVVSFDGAGTGTASMLYPAPNAAGLLAAVIAHGFLANSEKKAQKDKLQTTADEVLSPYKVVLDNFNYQELMRRTVEKTSTGANEKLAEDTSDPGQETVIESIPVFLLTQDQKTVILDNAIFIRKPGIAPEAAYRNNIRVVSSAMNGADPAAFWTANDGERIKDESAQLVAESLDIAFHDAAAGKAPDGLSYRTVRYREGTAEKIERAQVLSEKCDRLLIKNLRGELMSVPVLRSSTGTSATDQCISNSASQN